MTPRLLVATLALALGAAACGQDVDRPPNVVLIVSDDAGYADFGPFGDPEMATPAIDSIAANGVRFTQAYNAASVCSPSRAGLITGRYPQRFGHEFNLPQRPVFDEDVNDLGLPLSETTIADAMRDLGYTTVALGKWHLGAADRFHPLERGFDEFFGFLFGSRSYFPLEDDAARGFRLLDGQDRQPDGDYLTDVLAEETAARIERLRDQAFFLYVNFNAVHTPMHAKPEHLELFDDVTPPRRQTLAAMTVSLDEGVATILAALRDIGLEDDTIVFFVNDNGGATNNASRNGPLRGRKGDKFEGGIRVPFMVQWPARLPGGIDYDFPVTSMDIFPTIVAAAGGDVTGRPLDGVDLVPFLTREAAGRPHETLFWRRGAIAAARSGDWKLIRVDGEPTWLFDLARDPYETTNLIDTDPARARDLVATLDEWEAGTVEPRWRTEMRWTESQIRMHSPGTARAPAFPQQPGYTPTVASAPSTDIYLGTLTLGEGTVSVTDVRNLTDRSGYDNQPAFEPGNRSLLYTSARDGRQSDIYRYDIGTDASRQVTQTRASEFSATPLPSGDGFSSIHESATGQLLWRYGLDGASLGGILEHVQPVGYHAWGDDNQVLMFVLGGNGRPASLQLGDLRDGSARIVAENPGRSLHKVPGRHAASFVRKVADDEWWIEVLDLDSGEVTRLLRTRPRREDYAWTRDGRLVQGDGSKLYVSRPGEAWVEFADLASSGVVGISRIAISDDGTRIAIVGNRQD
jgi:arylsulfatase A-like enzyme